VSLDHRQFVQLGLGSVGRVQTPERLRPLPPRNFYVQHFALLLFLHCHEGFYSTLARYSLQTLIFQCIHKERVNKLSLFFLLISVLCAASAMYFFLHKSISWSVSNATASKDAISADYFQNTPAQSRQFNQECKLLRFYDFHDIWHFLSAIGMFFTFMVLLTLDDDLSHTHRTRIVVF
jgi:hypothetical protein